MESKQKQIKTCVKETVFGVLLGHTQYIEKKEGWENKSMSFDYAMDSLSIVETIMELESIYGITINEDEIIECKTPNEIINIIYKKISNE